MKEISAQEKRRLLKNRYVLKVTCKSVVFTSEFKLKALDLYAEGMAPAEIFERNGIRTAHFSEAYCHHCLKRWRKKAQIEGRESLKKSKRGAGSSGRPKTRLDNLGVEDLKAIIAVQEEFIAAIKKKRALARKN
jgi:transposase